MFGNVLVGQPTVQWTKITSPFSTLTATSSAPDFKATLIEDTGFGHGNPPTSAFTTTFTGPCTNCWLGVQFTPTTPGPQTATLTLTSTSSGTPSPFTLTGTGLPLTGLILTPLTQDFGPIPVHSTSAPTLFTLTNLTSATATLSQPTITTNFVLADPTLYPTGGQPCTGALAPNASCFLNVQFTPTTIGQLTGTLTIPTDSTPITAQLTGFGSPDPGLSLTPAALIFNNVPGSTATERIITVTNTGTATLQIAQPTTTTPNFAATTNCTTLAPAATCTITVLFAPTDALTADILEIPVTSSLTGPATYAVPLTGAYTLEDSGLQILPNQTSYGPTPDGSLGSSRQFTINNLTAKSLTLDIALPRQFVLASPPCAALAPNASCNFAVTFLPLTNGDITGTLFAQATPTDGSATLNGLAYVEGYGTGSATIAITGNIIPNSNPAQATLNFGQVASGQSATQTLTLTNSGTNPLTIRRLTSEWPFLITQTTCGATLTPNQNCTVTLAYTPINQIATGAPTPPASNDTGALVIESDALTSPDIINLTGTAGPISVSTPTNTAPLVSYTASANSLTFPSTQVGNAAQPQTIILANTGTIPIHITALQTTPDFTTQTNCDTILPSASCLLIVTFTPQPTNSTAPTDTRISALEITSDASTALDFISLLGTATPSPLTISPIALNFGSVQLGGNHHPPAPDHQHQHHPRHIQLHHHHRRLHRHRQLPHRQQHPRPKHHLHRADHLHPHPNRHSQRRHRHRNLTHHSPNQYPSHRHRHSIPPANHAILPKLRQHRHRSLRQPDHLHHQHRHCRRHQPRLRPPRRLRPHHSLHLHHPRPQHQLHRNRHLHSHHPRCRQQHPHHHQLGPQLPRPNSPHRHRSPQRQLPPNRQRQLLRLGNRHHRATRHLQPPTHPTKQLQRHRSPQLHPHHPRPIRHLLAPALEHHPQRLRPKRRSHHQHHHRHQPEEHRTKHPHPPQQNPPLPPTRLTHLLLDHPPPHPPT